MRSLNTNKVFVSAYRSEALDSINKANHAVALDMLRREGVAFTTIIGVWQGIREESFLLQAASARDHALNLHIALSLARLFKQDAVLEVGNDNAAYLYRLKGAESTSPEYIGHMSEIPQLDAESQLGYSIINGRYYGIKE